MKQIILALINVLKMELKESYLPNSYRNRWKNKCILIKVNNIIIVLQQSSLINFILDQQKKYKVKTTCLCF